MGRGREPTAPHSLTPGGRALRRLRQRSGLSLAGVQAKTDDAGHEKAAGHVSQIELGRIPNPDRETLEVVLDALGAGYVDRRLVLEAFGYKVPPALPTERDIEEARRLCRYELAAAAYPAHLVDDGQRIWEWNRYTPRLLGLHPDDPAQERFRGATIVDLMFDPTYGTSRLIANPEEYLGAQLRFVKATLRPYQGTPAYGELLSEWRRLPNFSPIWDALGETEGERGEPIPLPVTPLELYVPGVGGVLRFRLSSSPLGDPRFQVTHYIPHGEAAMRACATWAAAEGVP